MFPSLIHRKAAACTLILSAALVSQLFSQEPKEVAVTDSPRTHARAIDKKRDTLRREMNQLSKEDQRKLRRALREVWANDEVKTARETYLKAGETYQQSLHEALLQTDEALRPLLERLVKNGPDALPQAADSVKTVARMLGVPARLLLAHRPAVQAAYQKINRSPEIKKLRVQMNKSTGARRKELSANLKANIIAGLKKELPLLEEWTKKKKAP